MTSKLRVRSRRIVCPRCQFVVARKQDGTYAKHRKPKTRDYCALSGGLI